MHLSDGKLREYLDGALTEANQNKVESHLLFCLCCREKVNGLRGSSAKLSTALAVLEPSVGEEAKSASNAYQKFRNKEMKIMSKRIEWRPIWAIGVLLIVLVVAFSFEPIRAFASSLLNIFRVQQVAVVPVNLRSLKGTEGELTVSHALNQMFTSSTHITRPEEEPIMVSNATDAGKQLGFTPRLWRDKNPTTMRVNKGVAFNFVVDLQQLGDVLKEAEMPDATLPNNLDGVKISVDIPASLSTAYGECKPAVGQEDPDHPRDSIPSLESGCIHLLQIPSPTVTAPPEFDPGQLAKIGLQFLGMSAEEAVNYSQSVDWTSTLVIPVPRGIVDSEQISIDGVTGNLLHSSEKTNETMPETYTLIWLKDGILYGLSGVNDPQTVIDIANNLE